MLWLKLPADVDHRIADREVYFVKSIDPISDINRCAVFVDPSCCKLRPHFQEQ
jgi:hypothetical protein